ncbi:MAG: four helix bundle protein [Candidatus Liptonbacteria bacterium]|nr:four helix bundle protein [Candidatus Liptonbacteria bacterium]
MPETQNSKPYNLEERTFLFAKRCRVLVKELPRTIGNIEDGKQLARSSGSTHANFIEFVETLSKKDGMHRIKICRKEAKESRSWLRLLDTGNVVTLEQECVVLTNEAEELMRIFGSIIEKSGKSRS